MRDLTSAAAAIGDRHVGLALRVPTPAGRALVEQWIASPALTAWWGSRASAEARIRMAQAQAIAVCRMIEVAGVPIGYAQSLDFGAAAGDGAGLPAGAWECDIVVGSQPHRGLGYGSAALDALVQEVFATTLALACVIAIPVHSERVARACERIGFRWLRIVRDAAAGPIWIMARERPIR